LNRFVSSLGALVLGTAPVMYLLLLSLRTETFRGDIPMWISISQLLAVAGAVLLLAGSAMRGGPLSAIPTEAGARIFFYSALVNALAAAVLVSPILYPGFEFPILITRWPGIYMVIAYTFFVLVGVFGMVAWGVTLHLLPSIMEKTAVRKPLLLLQLGMMEAGVYIFAVSTFLGGYVGAALNYAGTGDIVVGASMEFTVIPAAIGIFLLICSTVLGVGNLALGKQA
jgi:hypothetical protein